MTLAPQRRLVCSAAASARLAEATAFLQAQQADRPLLVLAPSMLAATRLVHRAVAGRASFGWHRHTLDSLALQLATLPLARAGRAPLRGLGVEALCARVVHQLSQTSQLGSLSPLADRPGLPRALRGTLLELRDAGVAPHALAGQHAVLGRLLATYERALRELGLADRADVLHAATERVERGDHAFVGLPLLSLDVPAHDELTARFCAALAQVAPQVCWTAPQADAPTRRALEGVLRAEQVDDVGAPASALSRAQRGLFSERRVQGDPDDSLRVLTSPGESRECVELARHVQRAAAEGVPFDRVAILLRSPDPYRAPLEEALARAEIPAYFARGVRRPEPAGRALLALLRCAAEGLTARAFAEYLSLGQAPAAPTATRERGAPSPSPLREALEAPGERLPDDEQAPRWAAPRRWERWIVDAAVVGGAARWRRRLSGLEAAWRQARAGLPPEDPRRAQLTRDLAQLAELQGFALPVIDALQALPQEATWGGWLQALEHLAQRTLRQPEAVLGALDELQPLAPVGPVTLDEVLHVLERRLGDALSPSSGWGEGAVFVGAVEDARGRSFERVLVPGLAERIFPPKVVEDPVLPDSARAQLAASLPTNEARVARERLALHLAVGAAERQLVLSYPSLDPERGRPRVPSFYGLEVLRAAEGALHDVDALGRRAEQGAAPRMGWPAPDDPAHAVDVAEYDLAVLASLLRTPDEAKGAARYLLHDPTLRRSLRFRALRWAPKWSSADGLVSRPGRPPEALADYALDARAYSATALQHFAVCPYRFYLYAVVGVGEQDDPAGAEQLDPRQRGLLVHEAQRQLLQQLKTQGALPVTRDHLASARRRLDEILHALGARAREELAPAIDRVFDDALEALRSDLRVWLERMAEQAAWVPTHFELAFGLPPGPDVDDHSCPQPVELPGGLKLRGAIDLVERSARAGGHAVLRATDHKTGKAPDSASGNAGHALQAALYALALERLFPDSQVEGGRLYYCTSLGGFEVEDVPLDAARRAAVRGLVDAVAAHLDEGFFPAAPRDAESCTRCPYLRVCGPYEWERVAQKDPHRLARLVSARGRL